MALFQIGSVHRMVQNPNDDDLMVFLGTSGINWISEDCGGNLRALNAGKVVQEFIFHPTRRDWALAASWTSCAEFIDEPCKIYKELFVTKNLGEEWNYVQNYVYDFEWGSSQFAANKGYAIPDERIFLTRDDDAKGHQSASKTNTWSTKIDLFVSDDFCKTSTLLLESGNTIVKTPQYMFVAVSTKDEKRIQVYSSNYESGFKKIKKVRLPKDAQLSNTFTLMDTSENQVFLFIENHGELTPFGNLYISDEKGRSFTLSMPNVIKGNAVDFEKVSSLDGTFLINRYNKADQSRAAKTPTMDAIKEFDEADILAAEARKSRMQRPGTTQGESVKQMNTGLEVAKIPDSIGAGEVQDNVRTYITHNKGAKWELLRAPTVTSKGSPIDCHTEDNCSLHLEIYSH